MKKTPKTETVDSSASISTDDCNDDDNGSTELKTLVGNL
jgi:hypothetical protein